MKSYYNSLKLVKFMFVDEIKLIIKAGNGGPGRVSFSLPPGHGPDGGNGGKGGDVIIEATSDLSALMRYAHKREIKAENGEAGERNRKFGKNGKSITLILPYGCQIVELDTQKITEVDKLHSQFVLCHGGMGGRGNYEFRSSTNTTPMYAHPGLPGEVKYTQIVLKLIADYGLIGLPNAGKSSLLNELTGTHVKTAQYPFTTIEPNLGVTGNKIIADIPGLIEGASAGKGLGVKFLKHIEKTKMLLHCIASDTSNPLGDYKTIWQEMQKFNPSLKKKKEIILITKTDLTSIKRLKEIRKSLKTLKKIIHECSVYDYDSIVALDEILNTSSKSKLD